MKPDYKYWLIKILIVFFGYYSARAQIEHYGTPYFPGSDKSQTVNFIVVHTDSLRQINNQGNTDKNENGFKSDLFANTTHVNINLFREGKWDHISPTLNVLRVGIISPGAKSLGITFDPFFLLPGEKVFIYTPDKSSVAGAYTFRNNKATGLLAITSLPGDSIIIELQVQKELREFGDLVISTVSVGFKEEGIIKADKDEWYGRSADCHVDINCIDDPLVQQQKYSVCRLIIERPNGRIRCTGTLVNNANEDGLPYILTAGHCISDEYSANHTIAYFDYESPYCNGPDGELHSVSGGYLRSRALNLDFALIELTEIPPVDYFPVYSGWDTRGHTFDYSYTIHHPQGDVKKFANDSDLVQEGTFQYFNPGSHWLIQNYETGTTEAGSSGCPLFDKSNRLVGSLSGGGVECTSPIYDYYQKFSDAWELYPFEESQLKAWLDPENTGISVINNLDYSIEMTEILSNVETDDALEIHSLDNGWGYISGHNSLHSTLFAEHFYRNGSKYIYALKLNVAKSFANNINSGIKVMVWEGGNTPEQLIFEKDIFLFELSPELETYVRLDTLILVDRDFFVGYSIAYEEPSDTFALYTVLHDNFNENSSFMWKGEGWEYLNDGNNSISASLAINPLVLNYFPISDGEYGEYPFAEVTLYPNPTYDVLQILLENKPEGDVIITVYDLIGNILYKRQVFQPEPNFQFHTNQILDQGVFIIKIEFNNRTAIEKFIKLR